MIEVSENITETLFLETEKNLRKIVWKNSWRDICNSLDKLNGN